MGQSQCDSRVGRDFKGQGSVPNKRADHGKRIQLPCLIDDIFFFAFSIVQHGHLSLHNTNSAVQSIWLLKAVTLQRKFRHVAQNLLMLNLHPLFVLRSLLRLEAGQETWQPWGTQTRSAKTTAPTPRLQKLATAPSNLRWSHEALGGHLLSHLL